MGHLLAGMHTAEFEMRRPGTNHGKERLATGTKDVSHHSVTVWDKMQDQIGNLSTSTDLTMMMTDRKSPFSLTSRFKAL